MHENAASTLHLYRPGFGFFHITGPAADVLVSSWSEFARIAEDGGAAETSCSGWKFASCQSMSILRARSTTTVAAYVLSSQTFKFLCFHKLHNMVAKSCFCSAGNVSTRLKMICVADTSVELTVTIWDHKPVIRHVCTARGQAKNRCCTSSWVESQLTQFIGHCTPLSCSCILVGKTPLHILQTKFRIFGGTFSFQIPDQLTTEMRRIDKFFHT